MYIYVNQLTAISVFALQYASDVNITNEIRVKHEISMHSSPSVLEPKFRANFCAGFVYRNPPLH